MASLTVLGEHWQCMNNSCLISAVYNGYFVNLSENILKLGKLGLAWSISDIYIYAILHTHPDLFSIPLSSVSNHLQYSTFVSFDHLANNT